MRWLLILVRWTIRDIKPQQIAFAGVLGMIAGLTPLASLHHVIVVALVCFFRVNFLFFLATALICFLVSPLFYELFIEVGTNVLTHAPLNALWTQLYQNDVWQLTRFNHKETMGSLVICLLASLPIWLITYSISRLLYTNISRLVNRIAPMQNT